jgi:hypothetical protein
MTSAKQRNLSSRSVLDVLLISFLRISKVSPCSDSILWPIIIIKTYAKFSISAEAIMRIGIRKGVEDNLEA